MAQDDHTNNELVYPYVSYEHAMIGSDQYQFVGLNCDIGDESNWRFKYSYSYGWSETGESRTHLAGNVIIAAPLLIIQGLLKWSYEADEFQPTHLLILPEGVGYNFRLGQNLAVQPYANVFGFDIYNEYVPIRSESRGTQKITRMRSVMDIGTAFIYQRGLFQARAFFEGTCRSVFKQPTLGYTAGIGLGFNF